MAAAMLVVSWMLTVASLPFVLLGGAASKRVREDEQSSLRAALMEQRKAAGLFCVAGMAVTLGKVLGDLAWLVG